MEKLRILFAGYCEDPPICFVLMGNFLSGTTCNTSSGHLRQLFKSLAEMIKEFPNLVEQTRFIFVPGPSDSGFCNILPRLKFILNCSYLYFQIFSFTVAEDIYLLFFGFEVILTFLLGLLLRK
jgi:hypothetical protein